MPDPLRELARLQKLRTWPARDVSISGLINSTASDAQRTHKKVGALIELWEELVPAELASQTTITGLRAGVLHVLVDSAAAAFELDRLLRSGLTDQLRARFRGTLVRVKTRLGSVERDARKEP